MLSWIHLSVWKLGFEVRWHKMGKGQGSEIPNLSPITFKVIIPGNDNFECDWSMGAPLIRGPI
jgi:hypothetical protein